MWPVALKYLVLSRFLHKVNIFQFFSKFSSIFNMSILIKKITLSSSISCSFRYFLFPILVVPVSLSSYLPSILSSFLHLLLLLFVGLPFFSIVFYSFLIISLSDTLISSSFRICFPPENKLLKSIFSSSCVTFLTSLCYAICFTLRCSVSFLCIICLLILLIKSIFILSPPFDVLLSTSRVFW